MIKKTFPVLLVFVLLSGLVRAQEAAPEMADRLREDGKIWVVVAVLATIFAGILAYLIRLDRKVARLEKAASTPLASK